MKQVKQLLHKARELSSNNNAELNTALWNLICYSPKWPNRLHQQQLIDESTTFEVGVFDDFFSKQELIVKGYKWGAGKRKVLLTHGWGSKATDFSEIITDLKSKDFEVISFDAPGNGASEGELSNLLLYAQGVSAIINECGVPDILIGHSFGAMANAMVLKENPTFSPILISLSPLINLKEHFITIMNSAGVSMETKGTFFKGFKEKFSVSIEDLDLGKLVDFETDIAHLLTYDLNDKVAPSNYTQEFLAVHPQIVARQYEDIGHEKMLKDPRVLAEIDSFIR